MIFRVLVFISLVVIGYYLSRKVRKSKTSSVLVGGFLFLVLAGFLLVSKKIFALFGFSFYFILIILGLLVGYLVGMYKKK